MGRRILESTGWTRCPAARVALAGALVIWCTGIVMGLFFAKPLAVAFSTGSAAALGFLAGWFIYYFTSRRDGLGFLFGGNIGPVVSAQHIDFWPALSVVLLVNVPTALIVGLIARRMTREKPRAPTSEPMYDAQIDRAG